MRSRVSTIAAFVAVCALMVGVTTARAQEYRRTNLVSDGPIPAVQPPDGDLLNAWGLAAGPTPWWVADNGSDKSTIYNGNTGAKASLVVNVPGAPTGLVFNPTDNFKVNGSKAFFIFVTEQGTVMAWNPSLGTSTFMAKDNSGRAIYKGAALAHTDHSDFLYLTNFKGGTIDVYNGLWTKIAFPFKDPNIPAGYGPFGIQNVNNVIIVTYAKQDDEKEDDVAGAGFGYVDAYDTSGKLLGRLVSGGHLNAPWGLAMAPADFGKFSGDLLIGNFGDGIINAYKVTGTTATFQGAIKNCNGNHIKIDGLWALQFGNDGAAGPHNTLFFTAGPNDEADGLFGRITMDPCIN